MIDFVFIRPFENRWCVGTEPQIVSGPAQANDFFFWDFFSPSLTKIFRPRKLFQASTSEFCQWLGQFCTIQSPLPFDWVSPSKDSFQNDFFDIKKNIASDQFKKIVPVVFESTTVPPGAYEILAMLRALSKTTGVTPYGYCYGDEGVVGATPELILAQKKSMFFTAAVAGTRHRDSPVSLLHSKKDLSEHQFVVDDLVSRLSTWGQVTVDCSQEVAAGDLVHLKTDIQLQTQTEVSFFKVLEELHPTPALGAYPRESGLAWLKKQSGDRGGFGAPFGRMDEDGESTAWVGIRQLSWSKSGSRIGSGCGIVADSDFEKEWQELQFKRQSVKNLLGLCL